MLRPDFCQASPAAAGLALSTVAPGAAALPWSFVMVAAAGWLVLTSLSILRLRADVEQHDIFKSAFIRVNVFALVIMICLSLNALGIVAG
ncbi:MAG: hypothetical protein ABIG44_14650 [Planctomycetota bacterium]